MNIEDTSIIKWIKNLNEVVPEEYVARTTLGIPLPIPDSFPYKAVTLGLWDIVPLGEGGIKRFRHFHGLRLVGGETVVDSCRLVTVNLNTIITVASSLSTAVPMSVFRASLYNNPAGWRFVDEQWEAMSSSLIGLHRFFGGKDDLSALLKVIKNEELEEKVSRVLKGELNEDTVAASILEYIDPSSKHIMYRKLLRQLDNETAAPPPPELESLGPWSAAAASAVLMAYEEHYVCSPYILEAAWALAQGPAGLDTNVIGIKQIPSGGALASDMTLELAATVLNENQGSVPNIWKENPLWRATMKIAEDESSYDGFAHVEAARDLDEAGHPHQAFAALQSAAFWSITNRDEPLTPAFDAAHRLADSAGWTDLANYMSFLLKYNNKFIELNK